MSETKIQPPKSPIEVTIKIGAETGNALIRALENEAQDIAMYGVRNYFWGGDGTHGDVRAEFRDVSPEQYREELDTWFQNRKAEKKASQQPPVGWDAAESEEDTES